MKNQGWDWEGKYMEAIKADCITYDYIDEDGSKTKDLALPIGWVKEFINIALSHQRKEMKEKVEVMKPLFEQSYYPDQYVGYKKALADILELLK